MKKLKKMVLNDVNEMSKEELKYLKGGGDYACYCNGKLSGYSDGYIGCLQLCRDLNLI